MKKYLSLIILILIIMLSGCNKKIENEVKVILPSGTPLIAVGDLLDEENVKYDIVSGADLLTSALVSKSHDVVILPLTAGMKLYLNGSSNYKLHSMITFGNTYIVSRDSTSLDSIVDVNEKDILAYGQNNTPDIILKASLEANDVKANITYVAGVGDIVPYFVCNDETECKAPSYILSAEPTITTLELKYNLKLNVLSLSNLISNVNDIPQAAIFVNPDAEHKDDIKILLEKIEKNINDLNKNTDEYVKRIINKNSYFEKLGEDILKRSIPRSNIKFMLASENQDVVINYCNLLNKYNNKILAGKVVDEKIYY